MVATTGATLVESGVIRPMLERLFPLCTVVTPNVPEALALLRVATSSSTSSSSPSVSPQTPPPPRIASRADLVALAETLLRAFRGRESGSTGGDDDSQTAAPPGPRAVLLKGGHVPLAADGETVATRPGERAVVVNVLATWRAEGTGPATFGDVEVVVLETPFRDTRNTHGTGCTLASAIACQLSLGLPLPSAVAQATSYVDAAIASAPDLGSGPAGPLNHLHALQRRAFPAGGFVAYLVAHPLVADEWARFLAHGFPRAVADGTVDARAFRQYLVQDYLFLIQFARAHSLAAYKAGDMREIVAGAGLVAAVADEMQVHVAFCEGYGLSREEIEGAEEHQGE